jgi:hypothetical protein
MVGLLLAGITAAKYRHPVWGSSCARWPRPSRSRRPSASSTSPGTGPGPAWTGASGSGRWSRAALISLASWPSLSLVSGSAGAGSPTWAPRAPSARGWPRPPPSAWSSAARSTSSASGSASAGADRHPAARAAWRRRRSPATACAQGALGTLTALGGHHAGLRPPRAGGAALVPDLGHHPHGAGGDRPAADLVLGLSIVAPFIGLTGGASLLNQLVATNPASMVAAVFVLWGIVMLPLGTWTTSWRIDRPAWGRPCRRPRARSARSSSPSPSSLASESRQSRRWSSTTSSHWRCLRPTSRSTPTSSKPAAGAARWRSRCGRRCGR